jgi:hypothetical protein
MATGILATCKQIQWEAGHLFWNKNTFRFSSDVEWNGIRRFLTAIGPRAGSMIQKLELFAPFSIPLYPMDGHDYCFTNIREAKNHPKMHMGKAPKGVMSDR